ncbi:MAG: hypothetical protein ACLRX4_13750 [Oscillospiraceae bacterium]
MDRRSLLDRAAKSAEERVLLGHILDKYDQCRQRNLPTNTAFLSPAEAQGARDLLRAAAIHEGFALLGGYEGAERRMLFSCPTGRRRPTRPTRWHFSARRGTRASTPRTATCSAASWRSAWSARRSATSS